MHYFIKEVYMITLTLMLHEESKKQAALPKKVGASLFLSTKEKQKCVQKLHKYKYSSCNTVYYSVS